MGVLEHRLFVKGLKRRSGGKTPLAYPWGVVDGAEYAQYAQIGGVQDPSFRSCFFTCSGGVANHRAG